MEAVCNPVLQTLPLLLHGTHTAPVPQPQRWWWQRERFMCLIRQHHAAQLDDAAAFGALWMLLWGPVARVPGKGGGRWGGCAKRP